MTTGVREQGQTIVGAQSGAVTSAPAPAPPPVLAAPLPRPLAATPKKISFVARLFALAFPRRIR